MNRDTKAWMDRLFVIGRDAVPARFEAPSGEPLRLTFVVLPGTSASVETEVLLPRPGCEVDIAGLYLCEGEDRFSLKLNLRHEAGECRSRQLFKGMASGNARALFDGRVYVAHGAQKTVALQENHSLLLDAAASVESRPQLEIYADDVECSHGATVGSLDAQQQFYMQSRGIPREEALRLQKISFLSPVLERLPEALAAEVKACL